MNIMSLHSYILMTSRFKCFSSSWFDHSIKNRESYLHHDNFNMFLLIVIVQITNFLSYPLQFNLCLFLFNDLLILTGFSYGDLSLWGNGFSIRTILYTRYIVCSIGLGINLWFSSSCEFHFFLTKRIHYYDPKYFKSLVLAC